MRSNPPTVRVRIPVYLRPGDADTDDAFWLAPACWEDGTDENPDNVAVEKLGGEWDDYVRVTIEAEIPMPQPQTYQGKVTTDGDR